MDIYVINYRDQTSMALEMDEKQANRLLVWYTDGDLDKRLFIEDIGALDLSEIRSIIKQKPVQDNPSYSDELTEEQKEYLKQQGKWDEYIESMQSDFVKDPADF